MFKFYDQKRDVNSEPFDALILRKNLIAEVIHSDDPAVQTIRKTIEKNSMIRDVSLTDVENSFSSHVQGYWHFDITQPFSSRIKIVEDRLKFGLEKGNLKSNNVTTLNRVTSAEDIPMEAKFQVVRTAESMSDLESDYKFLLKGVIKLAESIFGDKLKQDIVIKSLYVALLHTINGNVRGDQKYMEFKNPIGKNDTIPFKNKKAPDKIIDKYSSPPGIQVEDLMKHSIEAYIASQGRDNKETYIGYLNKILALFNEKLDAKIFTKIGGYSESELLGEIRRIAIKYPNEKFTEEFIDKSIDVEEWDLVRVDDFGNEFGIEEYDDKALGAEATPLEPVGDSIRVELKDEISSLQQACLFSYLYPNELGMKYNRIYLKRLELLKNNEETFKDKQEIDRNMVNFLPAYLLTEKRRAMNFNSSISTEIRDAQKRFNMNDIYRNTKSLKGKELAMWLKNSELNNIASMIYNIIVKEKWSMSLLFDDDPILSIKNLLEQTLKVNNQGIYMLMGKEMDIQMMFKGSQTNKEYQGVFKALTEDGLIITSKEILEIEFNTGDTDGNKPLFSVVDKVSRTTLN